MNLKVIVDSVDSRTTKLVVEQDGVVIGQIGGVQNISWSTSSGQAISFTTITFANMKIEGPSQQVVDTNSQGPI